MLSELYDFKRDLTERGIFFSFSGPMSQDLLVEIGAILQQKLKLKEASTLTILRVFSMVVELAQNIIRYSAEKYSSEDNGNKHLRQGIITVGYKSGSYFVGSGNMIRNNVSEKLNLKLSKLQKMNRDEIKAYYKERRKAEPDRESKGAGLGFIEMAKKASKPIEFSIRAIDGEFSFFSIKLII